MRRSLQFEKQYYETGMNLGEINNDDSNILRNLYTSSSSYNDKES